MKEIWRAHTQACQCKLAGWWQFDNLIRGKIEEKKIILLFSYTLDRKMKAFQRTHSPETKLVEDVA